VNEEDYVTLTIVVRRDDTEEDPCDAVFSENTKVLFVGHQDGVTNTAIALGANPSSWS
jgi:hypothetical protein